MDNLRLKNPGIVFIFSLFAFFAIFFAGSTPRVLNPFFLYCFNKVPSLLAISKTDFICLNFLSVLCTNFSQYFFVTLEVPVTQTYFENKYLEFTVEDNCVVLHLVQNNSFRGILISFWLKFFVNWFAVGWLFKSKTN